VTRLYCSDAARLRGDDNLATAARTDIWILVELPIPWGRDPISDAALPQPVRDALRAALRTIPRSRLLFIRRRVECVGAARVYVARTIDPPGIVVRDLASLDDVASLPFTALAHEIAIPRPPLVLVCTHGQHDSCCGRRGYPLFDALQRRDDLDVWQCSHVGGDRFAANAVVLPWGLYYGPVEPRDADALADSIARGEILLPAYRGRASLPRPVQAAETFVRRTTNELRRDALTLAARETLVDGRVRITLRDEAGALHEVTMEHYVAAENVLPTCKSTEPQAIRQFRLVEYGMAEVLARA
jgi:hypothetical protein